MTTTQEWPAIAEYGQIENAPRSRRTVVQVVGRYTLRHGTAGYETAGSMARWTAEYWAVVVVLDGAEHGHRFRTAEEACACLRKWSERTAQK